MTLTAGDAGWIQRASAFDSLKSYLIDLTGLAYYQDKDQTLSERLLKRISEQQFSNPAEYLDFISSPDGSEELDILIDDLAIGETYFFRNPEQFEALRDTILPERIAAKRDGGSLRIWSAGCASGAEPYSIAILLEREWPEISRSWPVSILGTDICARRLERARQARFTNWELRGLPDDLRADCFENDGRLWQLKQHYARRVRFERHNLKNFDDVRFEVGKGVYDIILCRNVLIYFELGLVRELLARLRESLAEGGWLLVGHAEPFLEIAHFLTPVQIDGRTAYRRLEEKPSVSVLPTPLLNDVSTEPEAKPEAEGHVAFGGFGPVGLPERLFDDGPAPQQDETVPFASDDRIDSVCEQKRLLTEARQFADQADWTKAQAACVRYLDEKFMDPEGHFVLAMVHEHRGAVEEAITALRRTVYLDPSHALAHFHLGRLYALLSDRRRALRSFANVIDLHECLGPGTPVGSSHGIRTDELEALARQHAQRLMQ